MTTPRPILVVDDSETARNLVRVSLELEGHVVLEAADGDAALEVAHESTPALIILDVSLPLRQGLEVLAEVRADQLLQDVPVVMLTAAADEGTEWRARDLGATAYVAKPVSAEDLVAVVRKVLDDD